MWSSKQPLGLSTSGFKATFGLLKSWSSKVVLLHYFTGYKAIPKFYEAQAPFKQITAVIAS